MSREQKAFLAAFVGGTQEKAIAAWEAIENPADKFKAWLAASEFVHPKLGRTEVTGTDGGPLVVEVVTYQGERNG